MSTFLAFRALAKTLWRRNASRPCLDSSLTSPSQLYRGFRSSSIIRASKYNGRVKNEKIPFSTVQLVDPETGSLKWTPLSDVLAQIDKEVEYAELVVAEPHPIVKIINKEWARQKRQQMKDAKKLQSKKNSQKEFQFTWSISGGDLAHKLERVKDELRKGGRVDVVLAPKRRQKAPPPEEMRSRVQEIADSLEDVGKEWKEREIDRAIATIYLKGLDVPGDTPIDAEE